MPPAAPSVPWRDLSLEDLLCGAARAWTPDRRACNTATSVKHVEGPRIVIPTMARRGSGLWLPTDVVRPEAPTGLTAVPVPTLPEDAFLVAAPAPSDLDLAFVAPDLEVLDLPPLALGQIMELVGTLPFAPAAAALSAVMGAVWHVGHDQKAHLRLAEQLYEGRPILERLRKFVREDPHHVFFNEQHLCALLRLLVVHAGQADEPDGLSDKHADTFLLALLGVAGLTEHGAPDDLEDRASWAPWLLRAGLYFDRSNLGSDQARAQAILVEFAARADPAGTNWCDLASWMSEDVAGPAEQLLYGFAMAHFTKALEEDVNPTERRVAVVPDGLLHGQVSPARVARLIAASSATRAEFRATITSEPETLDHVIWDRTAFEQRPFLRLHDGRLILLGPRFLFSWMGEGFYYRLLDAASARPDPRRPDRPMWPRFTRFHGELMERYVHQLSAESHRNQERAGVVRISGELAYTGAERTERKSPDVVLDFGTDVVAVEVSGGRLPRRARILSDPAVMREVLDQKVLTKLRELDSAGVDVLDGRVPLPGLRLDLVQRLWPIVVVPSDILQGDVSWAHIEDNAPGLSSRHPAQQPPTLMSAEEYERLLALVEEGQGIPALLSRRHGSVYRRMSPSRFFGEAFPSAGRPRAVDEALRRSHAAVAALFDVSRADAL